MIEGHSVFTSSKVTITTVCSKDGIIGLLSRGQSLNSPFSHSHYVGGGVGNLVWLTPMMVTICYIFNALNWNTICTVSPLHTTIQVENFQRCEHVFVCPIMQSVHVSGIHCHGQLALRFLLLMILQLSHLPPPLPPPASNSSCLFTLCQPLYASCCPVQLYFSRYYTVRLKMFIFCGFFFNVLFV